MLYADDDVAIAVMPRSLGGLLSGRYALVSGRRPLPPRWRARRFEAIYAEQFERPVAMFRNGERTLWYFHHRFYWSDSDVGAEIVRALALEEEQRFQQTIHAAGGSVEADERLVPLSLATWDDTSTDSLARHVRKGQ